MRDADGIILVSLFLNAVLFGFVGAALGKSCRGRLELGALLGAILGPIGLCCIFLFDDERRRCPACRSVIAGDATKCRHCGTETPLEITSQDAPSISPTIRCARGEGLRGTVLWVSDEPAADGFAAVLNCPATTGRFFAVVRKLSDSEAVLARMQMKLDVEIARTLVTCVVDTPDDAQREIDRIKAEIQPPQFH